MPPKTSRRVMSRGPIEWLRQSIAQRFAATASGGAPDHEAAPQLLGLQPIMAPTPFTQHSSATSTSTTGRSFPRSIRCKSRGTSTFTSTSTRMRGIVVGKKTHEKARSKRMKAVRVSEKKVDHRSGSTPFAYRTKKLKKFGDKDPIPNTWVEVYKKNASDAVAAMTVTVEASIASVEASNPMSPVEGGSDSTPPAPITLPVETQISIVQEEINVRRETVIRGLEIGYMKDPQLRGGARTSGPSSEVEELRSTVARMHQEREKEAEEMRRLIAEQQRAMKEMQAQVRLLLKGNDSGGKSTSNQHS
ncbi:hypothetical protein LguiB_005696 [Lonicera macranthoides]